MNIRFYFTQLLDKLNLPGLNSAEYTNLFMNIHNRISEIFKRTALTFNVRMSIYRSLEILTSDSAAVPIYDAIVELREMENNKGYRSRLWFIYDDIIMELAATENGFSESVRKFFPQQDVMILAAAEQNDISTGFKALLESSKNLKKANVAFKAGMGYSLFLLVSLIATLAFFCIKIIPPYSEAIPQDAQLSPNSQFLLLLARNFIYWFPILIISLVSFVIFIIWALPNLTGKWRMYLEKIPPFNMYRMMTAGAFLFALNSLGKAGYSPNESLIQMSPLSKPYLRERVDIIIEEMAESGSDVGEALIKSNLNFPDSKMVKELAIYSKYSDSDSALDILSKTLAEEGIEVIEKQSQVLGRILMFVVFSCLGFLYMGMLGLGSDIANVASTIK